MIDNLDRSILAALQRNNRQSMADLGDGIGLSEPAVRRRVARLRKAGYILADVSLLDPARLGITVIVSIRFAKESQQTYESFKAEILRTPEISQGYTVTGEDNFIVIGHFHDMVSYDDWINSKLLTNQAISRSTTNVVYRRFNYDTAVPIGPE